MARKDIDWESVAIEYRAGIRSLKDIGTQFGVSDAGIIKRAKRDGWVRDLKAKIQAKAEAKVRAALVSEVVSPQTKLAEVQVIEIESDVQARIQLRHRKDIGRGRDIAIKMFVELEQMCDKNELLHELAEIVAAGDQASDRQIEVFRKVIGLTSRVGSIKQLVETMKNLIAMERDAFGLNAENEKNTGKTVEDILAELSLEDAFKM